MTPENKLALSFFAMTGIAVTSLAIAIKQEITIDKLTRENKLLKSVNRVMLVVGAMTPGFKDTLIDVAVEGTDIPDDISTL